MGNAVNFHPPKDALPFGPFTKARSSSRRLYVGMPSTSGSIRLLRRYRAPTPADAGSVWRFGANQSASCRSCKCPPVNPEGTGKTFCPGVVSCGASTSAITGIMSEGVELGCQLRTPF